MVGLGEKATRVVIAQALCTQGKGQIQNVLIGATANSLPAGLFLSGLGSMSD